MNKKFRDTAQAMIYRIINPIVRLLIRAGLTPNMVTSIGLLLNIGVAVIFITGAEEGHRGELSYVGWAGGLVLFAGLFDMLDGQVARLGNMSTAFGALYDSVLDRYSELVLFLGICYYLIAHHYFFSSLSAFVALIGSMMVSYTRARAEGLGISTKGGLMQRPERIILIGVSALSCGIVSRYIGGDYKLYVPGISFHVFETMSIFTLPLMVMAVLTNITAVNRLRHARKAMEARELSTHMQQKNKPKPDHKAALHIPVLLLLTFTLTGTSVAAASIPDNFPVPSGIPHLLFYIQRTPNTNTICYELNLRTDGRLDEDEPIHPFWLRYATENGRRKELTFIQKAFAYGIRVKRLDKEYYEIRSVAYGKRLLYLKRGNDHDFHVYTSISGSTSVLERIFINIDGGSFWHPNVTFIELKGTVAKSGIEVTERIKP